MGTLGLFTEISEFIKLKSEPFDYVLETLFEPQIEKKPRLNFRVNGKTIKSFRPFKNQYKKTITKFERI